MRTPLLRSLVTALLVISMAGMDVAAQAFSAKSQSNAYGAYLKLDGRWYGVTTNRAWDIDLVGTAVFVDDTTAMNCRRANGSFPSLGSGWLFGVGSPMSFIGARASGDPVRIDKAHPDVPTVIELVSLDGDLQCSGQVTAPVLTPPAETPIFVSSFE